MYCNYKAFKLFLLLFSLLLLFRVQCQSEYKNKRTDDIIKKTNTYFKFLNDNLLKYAFYFIIFLFKDT